MLSPRLRRARTLAGVLAALLAAPAAAVGFASAAQADAVRQQELWVLNAVDVAGAWQHTHGSGVTVALIDSGVNGQVSDLTGSVVTGRDFSGVSTPSTNANWGVHGTWMASLIAGHGHAAGNSSGIMGVAPAAKILSIRAVTDQGDPGYRRYQHESEARVQGHLAAAIQYAASKRVGVISMSLGYQGASLPVRKAIRDALAQGIVVVASSGNSGGATTSSGHGNAPYSFPADYPGVLGVGAVAQSGQPAGFSSDNLSVQVAAPGVRVPAQGRDGQYWLVSGTSPACALTAGVAALIKSVYPALAPALVMQAITASTANKPDGGYDEAVGFGTVDAAAALKMAGRLARDQVTGRGLVAAAQFGGGPGAIPAVPVAPRGKRQFLLDSLIALACLAFVLVMAFRLIMTRRRAVPPASWAVAGAPGGWTPGGGVPGPGTSGPGSAGPGAAGPGGAWPGDAWPDGGTGYGRSAGYWASGGYKPPARPTGYGPPSGFPQPADPGRPGEYGAPGDYPRRGDFTPPAGSGPSAGSGPPAGYAGPGGARRSGGDGVPGGYPGLAVPPPGDGQAAGSVAPQARYGAPPAGYGPAGRPADANAGPLASYPEPQDPLAGPAQDLPADDDTWPSSGSW